MSQCGSCTCSGRLSGSGRFAALDVNVGLSSPHRRTIFTAPAGRFPGFKEVYVLRFVTPLRPPNWWWRFWSWVFLGWRWKKEN